MNRAAAGEVWAVVPLKPLAEAKRRLADVLAPEDRRGLVLAMLRDVVAALKAAQTIDGILLVSRDPGAGALARELGIEFLMSQQDQDLNSGLEAAIVEVRRRGAGIMMILPGDVPLVRAGDIDGIIAALPAPPGMVLAPAADGDGTNCLVSTPPDLLAMRLGPGSASRHLRAAAEAGIARATFDGDGFALDIDDGTDFAALEARLAGDLSAGHSGEFLRRLEA